MKGRRTMETQDGATPPPPPAVALIAYDIRAAAAATSTSEKTIRLVIASGELPARKLGRKYLIEDAALRDWVGSLPAAGVVPADARLRVREE